MRGLLSLHQILATGAGLLATMGGMSWFVLRRDAIQKRLMLRITTTATPYARIQTLHEMGRRTSAWSGAQRARAFVERLIGYEHKRSSLRDIVLCVDQSGSMAASVVYAGVFGAVLASLRAVSTRMVVFDTAVVDLTEDLKDPVDLLFGVQLGGGTDINRALAYCQTVIDRPGQTILVLLSDLYEGGDAREMVQRAAQLVAGGVQVICLLALSDRGAPGYDTRMAAEFARLGIPAFACTPDLFPDLMGAAINRQDLGLWAARHDIVAARTDGRHQ